MVMETDCVRPAGSPGPATHLVRPPQEAQRSPGAQCLHDGRLELTIQSG